MKTNLKTNEKNVINIKNVNNFILNSDKIAIIGCSERKREIKAILRKLGMKNSRNLSFNSNSWCYYVNNGVVQCSANRVIPGYETMSIDTYYKKFNTSKAAILKRYGK